MIFWAVICVFADSASAATWQMLS